MDLRFYQQYPEFLEAIKQIEATRSEAMNAYHARLAKTFDLPTAAECNAAYKAIEQEHEGDRIRAEYRQRIAEAHTQYHVPVLESWQEALSKTGYARFHSVPPLPYYPAQRTTQATLRRHVIPGEDEDVWITVEFREVCTLKASELNVLRHTLTESLESHLRNHGIFANSWEAVAPQTPIAPTRPEHHRMQPFAVATPLSVQTDTNLHDTTHDDETEPPCSPSPLAQPDESDEERVKRLLAATHESAANDCLTEATYWTAYYCTVESADLEPIWTSIVLTERAQALLFPNHMAASAQA